MKVYSIHSYNSEGALHSDTPYAHEIDKARTLDSVSINPDCNQGGMVVLGVFEGNGNRPSHKGLGISASNRMYTLNSTEIHGVIYELSRENRSADGK